LIAGHLNLAADQVLDNLIRSTIRHMRDLGAGMLDDQLHAQML